MQLGMVGLGRMGASLVRRVARAGHVCVVFDRDPDAVAALTGEGVTGVDSLNALVDALIPPWVVWAMVPAGASTHAVIEQLVGVLADGDIVVDGGNTYYGDDRRRAELLAPDGIRLVDCGTSGGIWWFDEGYCLTLGGDSARWSGWNRSSPHSPRRRRRPPERPAGPGRCRSVSRGGCTAARSAPDTSSR